MTEPINWKMASDEAVTNLIRLIKTETVNPPGNELPAILVIKDILEKAGFPQEWFTVVESAPKRVNLVARLHGDGTERPLLLSGHVDVVPVEREYWAHDPFGGEIIEGEIWGRGALDMKGFLTMYLQVFLELFRHKTPRKRDIILAAIADEEAGFIHGSRFLVEQHRELIDAEYGLTEGGALTIHLGKTRVYPIQVAEKSVCWIRMRARGEPGHGSIPHGNNPVLLLSQAIEKIRRVRHLPVHLSPPFLQMLDGAGSQLKSPLSALTRVLHSPLVINLLLNNMKGVSSNFLRALVTNTISPNMLHAGSKINVIPSIAEVEIDSRLVPGQRPADVIREIQHIVGDAVEIEEIYCTGGATFSTETALYKLLEKRTHQMDPEGLVIPMLMPGATDACQYKQAGITVYGFTPGILPAGIEIMQMAHGHNERIPISYIESGLPVLWDVVSEFCR